MAAMERVEWNCFHKERVIIRPERRGLVPLLVGVPRCHLLGQKTQIWPINLLILGWTLSKMLLCSDIAFLNPLESSKTRWMSARSDVFQKFSNPKTNSTRRSMTSIKSEWYPTLHLSMKIPHDPHPLWYSSAPSVSAWEFKSKRGPSNSSFLLLQPVMIFWYSFSASPNYLIQFHLLRFPFFPRFLPNTPFSPFLP